LSGPEESPREFTLRAVILGALFGILFGAVSVYVGLRAGLTASASIPISVLSISILRAFGRSLRWRISRGRRGLHHARADFPELFAEHRILAHFFLALLGGWLGVPLEFSK